MFSLSLLKAASGKDELELGFLALGVLCIRLSICFWMFEFGASLNQGLSLEGHLSIRLVVLQHVSAS